MRAGAVPAVMRDSGACPPGAFRRPLAGPGRAALPLALLLALVGAARPGAAQMDTPAAPAMAEAPLQFLVGPTAGWFGWDDGATRAIDDAATLGLRVESRLLSALAFRFEGQWGTPQIRSGTDAVDTDQYMASIGILGRLEFGPFAAAGVVPYAGAAVGSVVHDPDRDGLTTRSQNAWLATGGVEIAVGDRFALTVEGQRVFSELENVFDPTERGGSDHDGTRVLAGIGWRF